MKGDTNMMKRGDLLAITVLLLAHLIIGKFYFDDLAKIYSKVVLLIQ
jgi:hypothetical protein